MVPQGRNAYLRTCPVHVQTVQLVIARHVRYT